MMYANTLPWGVMVRPAMARLASDQRAPASARDAARLYSEFMRLSDMVAAIATYRGHERSRVREARQFIAAGIHTPDELRRFARDYGSSFAYRAGYPGPDPDPGHPVWNTSPAWRGLELAALLPDAPGPWQALVDDAIRHIERARMHNFVANELWVYDGTPLDAGARWVDAGFAEPRDVYTWAVGACMSPADAAYFRRCGYTAEEVAAWADDTLDQGEDLWAEGPRHLTVGEAGDHPAGQLTALHAKGLVEVPRGGAWKLDEMVLADMASDGWM